MIISISCLPGMEALLLDEVTAMGGRKIQKLRQAVRFEGDASLLIRSLYELPSALKVYQLIDSFPVRTQNNLYRALGRIKWSRLMKPGQSLALEVLESGGKAPGPLRFLTLRAKDAIVDWFRRETGKRPSVDRATPDHRFLILFTPSGVELLRDAAGYSLSRRGYRTNHGGAPLNEALAWGILQHGKFAAVASKSGGLLLDPMCGSGTIPIEAALFLKKCGIPPHAATQKSSPEKPEASQSATPGVADSPQPEAKKSTPEPESQKPKATSAPKAILVKRSADGTGATPGSKAAEKFAFSRWPDMASELSRVHNEYLKSKAQGGSAQNSCSKAPNAVAPWRIVASDIDESVLSIAKANARRAGVLEYIEFYHSSFAEVAQAASLPQGSAPQGSPPSEAEPRLLFMNPPYDMRLALDQANTEYAGYGDILKQQFSGWTAHVFSANRNAMKHLGLRTSAKVPLKNGQLDASLHIFELY